MQRISPFHHRIPILSSLLAGVFLFHCFACNPGTEPLSPIPEISILSVSPTSVQEFQNQVILELEYLDYDGDLGDENPDIKTLWVQDSRLDSADWYHIPPIAPVGEEVPIRGAHLLSLLIACFCWAMVRARRYFSLSKSRTEPETGARRK